MYASWEDCGDCSGSRVCKQALLTRIGNLDIGLLAGQTVHDSLETLQSLDLDVEKKQIANKILKNCLDRLHFLKHVGLNYITLSRRSNTLS